MQRKRIGRLIEVRHVGLRRVAPSKLYSITDQARVCTEYAQPQGLLVGEQYADEGISGAALGNRPGVLQMIEAALAREFDVLLVADLSRLSRSQGDLSKMIDRLVAKGVRIVGVQDGYDSARRGHKLQADVSGIVGEAFREMIKERTSSSLRMRGENGHHTGGRAYGYQSIPVDPAKPAGRKRLVIDEQAAAVVREIFARYAGGENMRAIAEDLNARKMPSAGAHWKRETRRKDGRWLVSALHAILHNESYTGRMVYGRRVFSKDPDTGVRTAREVPPSEWIVNERPELAIVERELWDRVQARLGANVGAAQSRAKPAYVLSGLLVCGECGGKLVVNGTNGGRYICGTFHGGGCACTSSSSCWPEGMPTAGSFYPCAVLGSLPAQGNSGQTIVRNHAPATNSVCLRTSHQQSWQPRPQPISATR
jgi:site-specific DNA recombinase